MSRTWHEIRRCRSSDEAETLRAALIDYGIEAIVPDAHVMGVQPTCSRGGGARLLVFQEHVERAGAVLRSLIDGDKKHPDTTDADDRDR
ncbi:MAG: DUF2007 domain-containing protein [Acidimicrobiia bacterium]|nr:DUF2007 domain-containing protein [Acidimicrobiia bacterium]